MYKVLEADQIISHYRIFWGPGGESLTYVDYRDNFMNLWSLTLAGGAPRKLTDLNSDQTPYFAWSRDGKHLKLTRINRTSDVVLIRNFKK